MSLPSHADVAQLPVVSTTRVLPADIDENDHLRTVCYFDLAVHGLGAVTEQAGMGPKYIAARHQTIFTAEHHLRYVSELRLHDEVAVHVQLLQRSDRALHAMAYLLNGTRARLAYVLESTLLHIDLATRRPTDFPADIGAALDERRRDHAVDWVAPVCGTMGVRR